MPYHFLNDELKFPSAEKASHEGLLAIGGDLSIDRLLLAYRSGIFPWFNDDEPPLWWCPDPRFVLFPSDLYVSKSMQQLLKKKIFEVTVNKAFSEVIHLCGKTRELKKGTWITREIEKAYTQLNKMGYAVSVETWQDHQLVGGFYGIRMGNLFFGESMFSKVNNASKYAFITYVKQLEKEGVVLIDCQVYTDHLESLGAKMIKRNEFLKILKENL